MTEATVTADTASRCSKCAGPLDRKGYPLECRACWAKRQRDYVATKKEMTESRGFAAGVSAMRAHLAGQFDRIGSGSFNGYEAAGLIRQSKGPADVS
jgi:hypothetical protein